MTQTIRTRPGGHAAGTRPRPPGPPRTVLPRGTAAPARPATRKVEFRPFRAPGWVREAPSARPGTVNAGAPSP